MESNRQRTRGDPFPAVPLHLESLWGPCAGESHIGLAVFEAVPKVHYDLVNGRSLRFVYRERPRELEGHLEACALAHHEDLVLEDFRLDALLPLLRLKPNHRELVCLVPFNGLLALFQRLPLFPKRLQHLWVSLSRFTVFLALQIHSRLLCCKFLKHIFAWLKAPYNTPAAIHQMPPVLLCLIFGQHHLGVHFQLHFCLSYRIF
mmetsp:Transcript_45360/g.113730  ORF Transcript_45360/g.113730 Transcript_45360/m.113730 type:complete len:204 (-) Transcript_45360:806-1417(-)